MQIEMHLWSQIMRLWFGFLHSVCLKIQVCMWSVLLNWCLVKPSLRKEASVEIQKKKYFDVFLSLSTNTFSSTDRYHYSNFALLKPSYDHPLRQLH